MTDDADVGLAAYVVSGNGEPTVSQPGAAAPPDPDITPYSSAELAQLIAALTAVGINPDRLAEYQGRIVAGTSAGIELMAVGEALAEYGVGHGGRGIDALPAWVRLLAGAVIVGITVLTVRREFKAEPLGGG